MVTLCGELQVLLLLKTEKNTVLLGSGEGSKDLLTLSVPINKIYSSYKSCSILKERFVFFLTPLSCLLHISHRFWLS